MQRHILCCLCVQHIPNFNTQYSLDSLYRLQNYNNIAGSYLEHEFIFLFMLAPENRRWAADKLHELLNLKISSTTEKFNLYYNMVLPAKSLPAVISYFTYLPELGIVQSLLQYKHI